MLVALQHAVVQLCGITASKATGVEGNSPTGKQAAPGCSNSKLESTSGAPAQWQCSLTEGLLQQLAKLFLLCNAYSVFSKQLATSAQACCNVLGVWLMAPTNSMSLPTAYPLIFQSVIRCAGQHCVVHCHTASQEIRSLLLSKYGKQYDMSFVKRDVPGMKTFICLNIMWLHLEQQSFK
jgi:hypothetical protein